MQDANAIAILIASGWVMNHNTLSHSDCTVRIRRCGGCHRSNPFQWMALTGEWESERSIAGVHSSLHSLLVAAGDHIATEMPAQVAGLAN